MDAAPQKLLARFATESEASGGIVEARWEISANDAKILESGVGVSRQEKKGVTGGVETNVHVPPQLFRRHLAGHLEQLALSAIPVSFDTDQISESDSDPSDGPSDSSSRPGGSIKSLHSRQELLDYVQTRIFKYFSRCYGDRFAIEGGCPGQWTTIFAERFLDRTMLTDALQIEEELCRYLDTQTAQQDHRVVDPTGEHAHELDNYWISKKDLLSDGILTVSDVPALDDLHALAGFEAVKAPFDRFIEASLIPYYRKSDGLRPTAGGKSRLFFGRQGTGPAPCLHKRAVPLIQSNREAYGRADLCRCIVPDQCAFYARSQIS